MKSNYLLQSNYLDCNNQWAPNFFLKKEIMFVGVENKDHLFECFFLPK